MLQIILSPPSSFIRVVNIDVPYYGDTRLLRNVRRYQRIHSVKVQKKVSLKTYKFFITAEESYCVLLHYEVVQLRRRLPTFRSDTLPPYSG